MSSPELELTIPFENKEPQVAPFPIVGIGASAGGLEAISGLLEALPVDTGMAFVVVQHLDPAHKSELTTILSKLTTMKVVEIANGMSVEPNHVYVIPASAMLSFAERIFHLNPRSSAPAPPSTIDQFFQSLATMQSRLSIGVILSGTGRDGSEGLKAIKSACGITFAQDEHSARYPAMPRSAADTGVVDFVLPPAQIAKELGRISRIPYVVQSDALGAEEVLPEGDRELRELFSLLLRGTKVDFTQYKRTTVRRRIARRMVVHRCNQLSEYVGFLRQHPEEIQELFRDLLINVTSLFRDADAFATLASQLSNQIQNKELERSFRAWIPGCSTGEEVYSLAICVQELFEEAGLRPTLQFFGTDISERALEVARAGIYPERIVDELSQERLARYFRKIDGKYQISKAIRETCIFAKHDLTRDPPFSHLDLVSCRNVLIYFDSVLQKGLFPTFHYALNPTGLLFLGMAESLGASGDLFAATDSKYKILRRTSAMARHGHLIPMNPKKAESYTQMHVTKAAGNQSLGSKVDRAIRDRYEPDAVVINGQWQILQFRGQTGFYLEPAPGDASYHVLRMARGDLPYVLREVLSTAMERNAFVERAGIRVEQRGETRDIAVEVTPLESEPDGERSYLVVFRRMTVEILGPAGSREPMQSTNMDQRVKDLERQLADIRRHERATAEEHDAAMEELRALNEELGSANEELQSSNEELGTTKEELQSSNEELTTTNEELANRNEQLGVLNDDLNNLLSAVPSPILRVDRDLRLRRITPAAERLRISSSDLTHPIRDAQRQLGTLPSVESLIIEVLDKLTVQTYEFQDAENHCWSLSIRPYRTANHHIEGAVLTFTDTDALQHALAISEAAREYTDTIFQTVREPLIILTPELKIDRANASFYEAFHLLPAHIGEKSILELELGECNLEELKVQLEQVLLANSSFSDFEVERFLPGMGKQTLSLNARQLLQISGRTPTVLLAFEDISKRRKAEIASAQKLEQTGEELHQARTDLRSLAGDLMNAQDDEARRIASELHDSFSQRLAFLEITIQQYRSQEPEPDKDEIDGVLEVILQHISQLSSDIRDLSHRMHPSSLEQLGLVSALRTLAEKSETLRVGSVVFESSNVKASLPPSFTTNIYRIAQEALHNTTKYAPDATVTITLTESNNRLHLSISDKGPGFDVTAVGRQRGLGLISMEERARSIGGTLHIESAVGDGVKITLDVPLPEREA